MKSVNVDIFLRVLVVFWSLHEGLAQTNPSQYHTVLGALYDRIGEPVFAPRGENGNIFLSVPPDYVDDRYRPLMADISDRMGARSVPNATVIQIRNITLPDTSEFRQFDRKAAFSLFLPEHRRIAQSLVQLLLDIRTLSDFVSVLAFLHDHINPSLYMYAMTIAILNRNDTSNVKLPNFISVMPNKFFGNEVFSSIREQSNILPASDMQIIEIPVDYTANDLEPEHRLWYFREDVGLNLHHWQWHLVYPSSGPIQVARKDRRGELFYYLHQQIIARYNFERFCNRLPLVKRLQNWNARIPEGYFPKLDTLIASRAWPGRPADMKLQDINRPEQQIVFDIADMERWRERIFNAIHDGGVQNRQNQFVSIINERGIDILGDLCEASIFSINPNIYGDLHNLGHVAISYIHDPDGRHQEDFAVMGDVTTAMRDCIFYRWHGMLDDVFQEHKSTLTPYTAQELSYDGITVSSVEVRQDGADRPNVLTTYWQKSDIDISRGLDFVQSGPMLIRITHLQHNRFTIRVQVQNTGQTRRGTVRVFMAPKLDERNLPYRFQTQRLMFIELGRWDRTLNRGRNDIVLNSTDSSVTIPYERTFRNLDANRPSGGVALDQFNYCGCGWPQHLLIPKGTPEGIGSDLFVMVSDDRLNFTTPRNTCSDGWSYCGVRGQNYPDPRPMGFPFDRQAPRIATLRQFLRSNMGTVDVIVRHENRIVNATNSN